MSTGNIHSEERKTINFALSIMKKISENTGSIYKEGRKEGRKKEKWASVSVYDGTQQE